MKDIIKHLALAMVFRYVAAFIYLCAFLGILLSDNIGAFIICFVTAVALWVISIVYDWKFIIPILKDKTK